MFSIIVVLYLFTSLLALDFNPVNWGFDNRLFFGFFSSFMLVALILNIKEEVEQPKSTNNETPSHSGRNRHEDT